MKSYQVFLLDHSAMSLEITKKKKKPCKKCKYVETGQYATKQVMPYWRNQRKFLKCLEINKNENMMTQIL